MWIGIALVVGLALFGLFVLLGFAFLLFDKDDEDVDFDDLDDAGDVRSTAAQLELEHDWWSMTIEALEALPAFADAVASRPSWSETTSPATGSHGRSGTPSVRPCARTGFCCVLSRPMRSTP